MIPKIIIKPAYFLDPVFIGYVKSNPRNKDWEPPTDKEVLGKIDAYRKEWGKHESKILEGLFKVSCLSFYDNVIDVYIVSACKSPFSDPIVIPATYTPETFVDVLTHELIHRLLTRNREGIDFENLLSQVFIEEDNKVKVHIFVHAVHQALYLDVFNDKIRLEKDIERSAHMTSYQKSWDLVDKTGYTNVLSILKEKLKARY